MKGGTLETVLICLQCCEFSIDKMKIVIKICVNEISRYQRSTYIFYII